ncbi:hypothetical protein HBI56_105080 [Parastagonospora nodorum]|uniref:Uncharacterized protein n=2 Tax=Phaeosphaeria nodorum (strain SN15 / ATCC MYA-4574 / FGSC 10173) TaxID=321614 RepID=A0A7U2FCG1_PHANO|nr:hypothetical protein SNOG_11453 [Parastagonospora nodorum SN15]KAH3911356.1 hypothetical protein HBH56_133830 [Parastagonospora nodorum]EAT81161.1 hypothetical protein SNOG_11453 [Parastagonospora nodorum SN15]KAH3926985.1 hypothetical protein HBH54_159460 [Parastagonospora nodorum]KAH3949428.1 hypothetical protein HBH53_088900 [Parastagonospora nodorum]KAH3974620.1 hypothetical protein HBH52_132840 [Parastagonospora nodorum]
MKFLSLAAFFAVLPALAAAVAIPAELQERQCQGRGGRCAGQYECCANTYCVEIICNSSKFFCEPLGATRCINPGSGGGRH